jgi:hypothetical protein
MKRLSATMIPTSPILPLLCAPNGWSLIDTRDTCAVCCAVLEARTSAITTAVKALDPIALPSFRTASG